MMVKADERLRKSREPYFGTSVLRLSLNACAASQALKSTVTINIEARDIGLGYGRSSLPSWSYLLV